MVAVVLNESVDMSHRYRRLAPSPQYQHADDGAWSHPTNAAIDGVCAKLSMGDAWRTIRERASGGRVPLEDASADDKRGVTGTVAGDPFH